MKTSFKATDKDMKCRGAQYELNIEYRKPEKDKPNLCSADGFHYANRMKDVITRYPINGKNNRYFKIEVLGNFNEHSDEGITTAIKFIEEISLEEVQTLVISEALHLDLAKNLLSNYPTLHLGGSQALFLHGIRLKRWFDGSSVSDLDIIAPYFDIYNLIDHTIEHVDNKPSGNDYDYTHEVITPHGVVKIDVAIDPKEAFEIIEYKGFKYRVGKLEIILAAKLKYAAGGNKKHLNDIYEMTGKKK